MGCGPSQLQDSVINEEYSYRRPVRSETRKRNIEIHNLQNETCDKQEADDFMKSSTERYETYDTVRKEKARANQNLLTSRLPENGQTETSFMTNVNDAEQDKHEDTLNKLQRNRDNVINISHKIDTKDSDHVINGTKHDQNLQSSLTENLDVETERQMSELNTKTCTDQIFNSERDDETEINAINNIGGEIEISNITTEDSNRSNEIINEASEDANVENNETQSNSLSQNESNVNAQDESSEIMQDEEKVDQNENESGDDTVTKPNPEPLTQEQSEAVCMMYYGKIEALVDSMKDKNWITDDGSVAEGVVFLIDVLKNSYSGLYAIRALFNHIKEFREKVAKLMLKTKIAEKICEIVVYACEKMPVSKYKKADNDLHVPVHYAMHVFANFTDTSPELAETLANYPGFLVVQRKIQKDFTDAEFQGPEPAPDESDCACGKCIVSSSLCMIHNISMVDSTIPLLRGHNFVDVLQPYLKSKDKEDHLGALATLAAIVDEKESAIINSNKKVVKYLMKTLKYGMRREERRFNGWSCKECGLTIKILARNDANKKLLVQLGALRLLVKLAKGSTEEQIEAAGALWALSFDHDNRKKMVDDRKLRVIQRLSDLKDSENAKIQTAATGALWNLREDLTKSDDSAYQELGKGFVTDVTDKAVIQKRISRESLKIPSLAGQGHIFISYQWTNQRILIDIRNELIKHGHKVWMDVDNMQGSTLQAMAEAVEDADVVLVCFSQKYKNSPNCRAEAEYTFQRQKPIIPLRMETNYKPDGWLGILVGTKLFYDFSGKYNFQEKLSQLLKVITSMKNETLNSPTPKIVEPLYHSVDRVDGPIVQQAPESLTSSTNNDASGVKSWTDIDVRNWIRKHNLPEDECSSFSCDEICLLLKMMNEAPESFYKGLQRKFNYDFKIISQLVKALEAINTQ